jgi:hypothetical protein
MNMDTVWGIVRHILTFGGGLIVGKGWLDEATMNAVVGAVITIGGAVWSIIEKRKRVTP